MRYFIIVIALFGLIYPISVNADSTADQSKKIADEDTRLCKDVCSRCLRLGDSKTIHCFDEAITSHPKVAQLYLLRGFEYYTRLKEYQKAIDDFTTAIQLDPKGHSDFYVNRAQCYRIIGKNDLADKDWQTYWQIYPDEFLRWHYSSQAVANGEKIIALMRSSEPRIEDKLNPLIGQQAAFFKLDYCPAGNIPRLDIGNGIIVEVDFSPESGCGLGRVKGQEAILGIVESVDLKRKIIHIHASEKDWVVGDTT